jgi:hypothetical protein
MRHYLEKLHLTPKRAATGVALLASVYFSLSQLHNQKVRQQRDLETSSVILADGLAQAVEPLVGQTRSRLQELADRFGKRGHLAGIAVFDKKGQLLARSKNLPKSLTKPPRIAYEALSRGREAEGYEVVEKKRLRVNAVPLEGGGVLAVFHDPAFLEARMERTKRDSALRMLYQAGVFLLAIGLFELLF